MEKMVHVCMVIALVSLLVGAIATFTTGYFWGRITPRALLIFAGVSLLFGINFALLELIAK